MIIVLITAALLIVLITSLHRFPMPDAARSFLAVFIGFFSIAISVTLLTILKIRVLHFAPTDVTRPHLLFNMVISLLTALLGGWITASLAPRKPFLHGIALAVLTLMLSLAGLLHPHPGLPLGYVLFLAFAPPLMVLGGTRLPLLKLRA